jgi:hypothetical protein
MRETVVERFCLHLCKRDEIRKLPSEGVYACWSLETIYGRPFDKSSTAFRISSGRLLTPNLSRRREVMLTTVL